MALTDEMTEQIPGTNATSAYLDPLLKRRRLADALALNVGGADDETTPERAPERTAHRIMDDNQTGNRSGGPAGAYQDPGKGRLADLMSQRAALDQAPDKPSLGKRLLSAIPQLAITGLAAGFGGTGGTIGAEKGMEEGIARRHQVQDIQSQRRDAEKIRLSQEIDAEARAGEQRQFQHGEDILRQQTSEAGLTSRENIAAAATRAAADRLATTIKGRSDLEGEKQEGRESLEDQKQEGRMALQRAKSDAQMAIQRYRTAHPNANIPPILGKAFQTYQGSQSRMDVMEQSYDEAIRDPGNQQAQLNLLASHLGMTMGLQPGARMNQAIINEAKRSGYLDERIEAHFGPDGYMTGVVLTPRQMGQMVNLARQRLMEDARAVKETEAYLGRTGNAPIEPKVPPAVGGGAGQGAGGAGATNAAKPAHKVGEKVTYKGKEYTIGSINADGSYVLK